jgi:hypothetical protein
MQKQKLFLSILIVGLASCSSESELSILSNKDVYVAEDDVSYAVDLYICSAAVRSSNKLISEKHWSDNDNNDGLRVFAAGRMWYDYYQYLREADNSPSVSDFEYAVQGLITKASGPDGLLDKINKNPELAYDHWTKPGNCPSAYNICDKVAAGEIKIRRLVNNITKECSYFIK